MEPNLFVIGAAKCGTTTMHDLLGRASDIFMSEVKELHYLAGADVAWAPRMPRSYGDYLSVFREGASSRYRGESSPSYLWSSCASNHPLLNSQSARLIVLLRDPVERMLSHYWMDVRSGMQSAPVLEALQADMFAGESRWNGERGHLYWELSRYANQLERYQRPFDEGRLIILNINEFKDMTSLNSKLEKFLGVPMAAHEGAYPALNGYGHSPRYIPLWLRRSRHIRELAKRVIGQSKMAHLLASGSPPKVDDLPIDAWRSYFEADGERLRSRFDFVAPRGWYLGV